MAGTHHITRWNKTEQRENGCNEQTVPTDKHKNPKIIFGSNTIFCEIHTEPIQKDGQYETNAEKRSKMGVDRRPKRRFQQTEKRTDNTTMPSALQRQQKSFVTTDACNTVLGIALWQRQNNGKLKAIAYASRYLNDAEKEHSVGELELLAVVWDLERF